MSSEPMVLKQILNAVGVGGVRVGHIASDTVGLAADKMATLERTLGASLADAGRTGNTLNHSVSRARDTLRSVAADLQTAQSTPFDELSPAQLQGALGKLDAIEQRASSISGQLHDLHVPARATEVTMPSGGLSFPDRLALGLKATEALPAGQVRFFVFNDRRYPLYSAKTQPVAEQRKALTELQRHGTQALSPQFATLRERLAGVRQLVQEAQIVVGSRQPARPLDTLLKSAAANPFPGAHPDRMPTLLRIASEEPAYVAQLRWAGLEVTHRAEVKALMEHWLKTLTPRQLDSALHTYAATPAAQRLWKSVLEELAGARPAGWVAR